jgi:hypothetical protein
METFRKRFLTVQMELSKIALTKDAENPFFSSRYLTLNKLVETILPIVNKHGLILTQTLSGGDQINGLFGTVPSLTTSLMDSESDAKIEASSPLILAKSDPQAVGSSITYYKRYAILSMFCLVADEDDDAEKAMPRGREATLWTLEEDEVSESAPSKVDDTIRELL